MKLQLDNIQFLDLIRIDKMLWVSGSFNRFSFEFEFGKSYLLTSMYKEQNEALSYLVSGILEPSRGSITLDGEQYSQRQRRQNSWHVRYDEIKRFGKFYQPLKNQIQQGIRKNPDMNMTEENIKQNFGLTEARYGRLLRQFSHEAWLASCAIGFAHGKRIFCFPTITVEMVDSYRHRFRNLVQFLKSQGALILFPQLPYVNVDGMVDEIVHTHRKRNYSIGENGTWVWKSLSSDADIQIDNPNARQKLINIFEVLSNPSRQQALWVIGKSHISSDLDFENIMGFLLEDTALSHNPYIHMGDILKFEYEVDFVYETLRLILSLFDKIGKSHPPEVYIKHSDWRYIVEISKDVYDMLLEE